MSWHFFLAANIQPFRSKIKALWDRSFLKLALYWWRENLLACLPGKWKVYISDTVQPIRVDWPLPLDVVPGVEKKVILALPASEVLVCPISLPWGALRKLRAVVNFEVDKYTPFSADQVRFFLLLGAAFPGKSFNITLVVIEYRRLQSIIEKVHAEGLKVDRIDVKIASNSTMGINLMPLEGERKYRALLAKTRLVASSFIVVLAVSVGVAWLDKEHARLDAMRQELKLIRNQAQEVEAMRQRLQTRKEMEQVLRRSAPGEGQSLAFLSVLTHCLGADTWLTELNNDTNGELRMVGYSRQASALPARLMDCAGLDRVRFQGTVQADRNTALERFTLLAQRPNVEASQQ